jgi:hypothetical protein
MKCQNCPYYKQNPAENECTLVGFYCFYTITDCRLVNADGTVNKEEMEKSEF